MLRVSDSVADRVWPGVTQCAKWQHIGDQINAAPIFAGGGLRKRGVECTAVGWSERVDD